jgi:centromere protein J
MQPEAHSPSPEEVIIPTTRSHTKPQTAAKQPEEPEMTFSPPIFAAEETVMQARRKAKNFDEIPISTANKGFNQLLEAELEKDSHPTVVPEVRHHSYLKKGSKTTLALKAAQQKSEEENAAKPPPSRRDFLKRKSGNLCVKKGQLSPPQRKDSQKPQEIPRFSHEKRVDLGPDQVLGPPGVDVIERLKREVSNLQAEVSQMRSGPSSDLEDALNTAIELAKNEREEMRQEFAAAKRQEAVNMSRDRKVQSKEMADAETLKARIRLLQEEAKAKEDAHRTACDSIRQQLESLRKKSTASKTKPNPFKPSPGPETRPAPRAEAPRAELPKAESSKTTSPVTGRAEIPTSKPIPSREEAKVEKVPKVQSSSKSDFSRPAAKGVELSKGLESVEVKVHSQTAAPDGKIQRIYTDGKKEIVFPNGVRKEVMPDGATSVYFTNKDVKHTFPDGKVVYHFSEAQTTQTTFPDKLQVFQFSNGQTEKHFPDGTKEITFTDGTVKTILQDGQEESVFPDGTIQRVDGKGVKYIESVSGQRDTLYPDGTKVREYPDGTVKKYRADGRLIES